MDFIIITKKLLFLFEPNLRHPLLVQKNDLNQADLVIAVKEAEHRPYLNELLPEWENKITSWHIDDMDCARPEKTLAEIEQKRKI